MSDPVNGYGRCPICKAWGVSRERRPNGNDRCENQHIYPSRDAIHDPKPEQVMPRRRTAMSDWFKYLAGLYLLAAIAVVAIRAYGIGKWW